MGGFLYGILLQWKLDLRNKGILITYYIVPIVFFMFMGGIFTSIDPIAYKTLIPSMTVFGVTMGAIIGSPNPLIEVFRSDIKKSYRVAGIPLWTAVINNFISGFIHLFVMSLVIFFMAQIAFNASVPTNIGLYFISLIIFLVVSLVIGTVLGLVVKSQSRLTMISQFIFLPSIMLSGIMFPSNMLPEILQIVGNVFPATWGFESMINSKFQMDVFIPLIIIFVIAASISLWKLKELRAD